MTGMVAQEPAEGLRRVKFRHRPCEEAGGGRGQPDREPRCRGHVPRHIAAQRRRRHGEGARGAGRPTTMRFWSPANTPHPLPPMQEQQSTIHLNQGDVTLFQSLGESRHRQSCLVLYSGMDTGKRYALDAELMVVGRAPESEVFVDNPGISRRHAELRVAGDTVTLRDLGSSNGTHVNDERVDTVRALRDGDLVRLGNVVLKFYERHSVDALLHDRIYRMATVDVGTEVFSKKYTFDALRREIRLARRTARALSLVCLDLDHFKSVNDRYGHNAGDLVLRQAASALQAVVRGTDILGRTGGEEFVVVLPDTPLAAAAELAERMRVTVAEQTFLLRVNGERGSQAVLHRQTVSVGAAQLLDGMRDAHDFLGAADAMLYAAKRGGRNRVCA
jgi:diguanylate cyclase (GGDEF)-like protein